MRVWAQYRRPFSIANLQEAQHTFEQALTVDPRSIDARIGLAQTLIAFVALGWSSAIQQDEARAEQLLSDALGREPNSTLAHYALGMLRQRQHRLAEARTEMEAAIALDRNNAWAAKGLGQTLMFLGRPQEGIPHVKKAIRLNPFDPNVAVFYATLASSHLLLGHVDQSIDLFRKAIAANPSCYCHLDLARALGLRGDLDEARAELAESLKLNPGFNSFAALHAAGLSVTNSDYLALADKTINLGLRRAGFPEE
jgi:adenylate cyclase